MYFHFQSFFKLVAYPFVFFLFFFFGHLLLVAIFYSEIVQHLFHLVVGMFSYHLPQLVGRIFFRCFGMSCFVCILLPFLDVFLIFLLLPVLSGLFPRAVLSFSPCVAFSFLSQHVPAFLICFIIFASCRRFLICVSSPIFNPGFDFLLAFYKGTQIFTRTNFAPA